MNAQHGNGAAAKKIDDNLMRWFFVHPIQFTTYSGTNYRW
jgi:hypothetical protein